MNVYVIVLNYQGKLDSEACIRSLQAMDYPLSTLIIVDNGSKDDSVAYLKERFPDITLIETGANLGYAEGNNVGIRYALKEGADSVVILNNDTIVAPDMLSEFVRASQKQPKAIFGGRIYRYQTPQYFDHFGGMWDKKRAVFDLIAFHEEEKPGSWQDFVPLDYVCGCVLFIPRSALEEVGLLEAKYFLYFEEADWCFRARKLGYQPIFHPGAKLWHKGSASFSEPRPPQAYYFWRNRLLWMERNYSRPAFIKALLCQMLPKIGRLYLSKWWKGLQRFYLLACKKEAWTKERRVRYLSYQASIQGAKDYFKGKFDQGPSWI